MKNATAVGRHVHLFGQLTVYDHGQPLSLPRGKPRQLFAYLALHGRTFHPRDRLAGLFWPDAPTPRARRHLSDALYRLRQTLGEHWLLSGRESVGLGNGPDLSIDMWEFENEIREGTQEALARAVALYRGELLAGVDADWALAPRVALHESYLDALETLGRLAEEEGETGKALVHYRQLSLADPLRESSYRGMMRVLGKQNRYAEALQLYESLVRLLDRELEIPPEAATRRLAQSLRDEMELVSFRREMGVSLPGRLPFVGRKPARAAALRAIELTLSGHGGVLLVEGEAGMGKSRFLEYIRESATWRGAIVLSERIGEYPAPTPLAPLEQALTAALASAKTIPIADILPAETLAALAVIHPAWRARAALADLPAAQAKARFLHALSELLVALSDFAAHIIILDDMHRAEPSLWEALSTLTPILSDRRLLLVMAYRPDETPASAWKYLRQWDNQTRVRVARLDPLSQAEVALLLPDDIPVSAAEVRAITGGNPFFVQEYLLGHRADEPLHHLTVAARAASLPAEEQAALEGAAVLGDRFSFALWRDLLYLSNRRLAQISASLIARVLLHLDEEGYSFVHDLVQETIYRRIPEERRQRLHARAAKLLAQTPDESQLRLLALHLDRAGQSAEAARVYVRAGRYEMTRFAYPEAELALSRGLELASDMDARERVEGLLDLARVCDVTGHRERQQEALDEALALARELGDESLLFPVMTAWSDWAIHTGRHEEAEQQLQAAAMLAQSCGDAANQLEVQQLLGDLYLRMGQMQPARTSLAQALALARTLGDRRHEGRALDGLAWASVHLGEDEEMVLALYQRALDAQREGDDLLGEARTLLNLFSAYENMGAWDRMEAVADEVLAAQKRVHYRLGESIAHQSLGMAAYALGDYEKAWAHVRAARQGFETVGERAGVIIATDALGLIAFSQGRVTEAEAYFREALSMAGETGVATFEAYAQQDLAFLLMEQARNDEAAPLLDVAISQWRACGDALNELKCEAHLGLALLALGERARAEALAERGWQSFEQDELSGDEMQRWLWALARLCNKLSRLEAWEALVRAAYAELQRQGRAIADDDARARFFHAVPLNRAIVDARDRLMGVERQREVWLARVDAPLGRALREEERLRVVWTVSAPEDEVIADKGARRRSALTRLLREAAAQNAAATDHDLAAALGVSRRTILRDMEHLAQNDASLPTRRRSRSGGAQE